VIRRARMGDVPAIQALLRPYADQGVLLPRSLAELYECIRDFILWEEEGEAVGVAALHATWEGLGEIRCLAVRQDKTGRGIGRRLVQQCLEDARALGLQRVFVLTYVPGFFLRLGFKPVDKGQLPHKVWAECVRCVKFPVCDEEALWYEVA